MGISILMMPCQGKEPWPVKFDLDTAQVTTSSSSSNVAKKTALQKNLPASKSPETATGSMRSSFGFEISQSELQDPK